MFICLPLEAHNGLQAIWYSFYSGPDISLPDRRLSSGLSGALKFDGRRRKKEPAVTLTAKKNPVVTAFIYQPPLIRPSGPGGGGCSVGATGVQVRRGSCRRGARGFRSGSVRVLKGLPMCVVTNYLLPTACR